MPGAPVSNPMKDPLKFYATKQISSGPVMQKHREMEEHLEDTRRKICQDIVNIKKRRDQFRHENSFESTGNF